VVDHIEGCTEVGVEEIDAAFFKLRVLNGVNDGAELSHRAFLGAEAFL